MTIWSVLFLPLTLALLEMAMWSLLRGKEVLMCAVGSLLALTWVKDITKQLKLDNVTIHDTSISWMKLPNLN